MAVKVAGSGTKRSGVGRGESMGIMGRMSEFVGIDVDSVGFVGIDTLSRRGLLPGAKVIYSILYMTTIRFLAGFYCE